MEVTGEPSERVDGGEMSVRALCEQRPNGEDHQAHEDAD
jgi:hypothetical protein